MSNVLTIPDSALINVLDPSVVSRDKPGSNGWANTPYTSFSGADIVVEATVPGPGKGETITLGELQTLSYSMHRENRPVRAVGHVAPVGFVKGPRTIAGTMIWTNFNHYGWYRLAMLKPLLKKSNFPLADMLPPMDITVTLANEFGSISGIRIMGVTITDEGGTMSIDDLILESTVNYMARGLQPLIAIR